MVEPCFLKYIDCYEDGIWNDDKVPFISICSSKSCPSDGAYCGDIPQCLNKWRDQCFHRQHMYETFTTYYPSDEEIANDWIDRRIKRIKEVPKKRYYYSGQEMLDMLSDAADFDLRKGSSTVDDDLHSALEEIRSQGYSISMKRFKIILKKNFKDYYSTKFNALN
jgi:hypothetical protein